MASAIEKDIAKMPSNVKFSPKILLLLVYLFFCVRVIFSSWLAGIYLLSLLSIVFVWEYEKRKKRNPLFSYINVFIAGNVLTIGAGVILRVFGFPNDALTYTTGLDILVPLLFVGIISTLIGMVVYDFIFRHTPSETKLENINKNSENLFKRMFVFSLILTTIYNLLCLNSQVAIRDTTNEQSTVGYILQAFTFLQYIPYIFLGLMLGVNTKAKKFWLVVAVAFVSWSAFIAALRGGRGIIVYSLLLTLLSREMFKINYKRFLVSLLCLIAFTIPMLVIVAEYRGESEDLKTGDSNLLFEKAGAFAENQENETSAALILSRIYEGVSGKIVDIVLKTGEYAGFKNMDSLLYTYIPNRLLKSPVDKTQGNGVLIEMGLTTYELSMFTKTPVILLADSFRRWGVVGVIVVFIFCGFSLNALQNLLKVKQENIFFIIMYPLIMMNVYQLYVAAVPNLLNILFYQFVKYGIIVAIFVLTYMNIFNSPKVFFRKING